MTDAADEENLSTLRQTLLSRALLVTMAAMLPILPLLAYEGFRNDRPHLPFMVMAILGGTYALYRSQGRVFVRALPLLVTLMFVVLQTFTDGLSAGGISCSIGFVLLTWIVLGRKWSLAAFIYVMSIMAFSSLRFFYGWIEPAATTDPELPENWLREAIALTWCIALVATSGLTWYRTLRAASDKQSELVDALKEEIAAREKAEQHLVRAQKMEAIGLVAGGVAHDFNNALTVILGEASLLALSHDQSTSGSGKQIEEAAKHAGKLTQQLLIFARQDFEGIESVQAQECINAVLRMSERILPSSIHVRSDLEEKPLWIRADPTQLQQVVLNLIINARDAMEQGQIDVGLRMDDGWILLEVKDQGRGIPESHHARIFEPFFTTKEIGVGTGLGLPVVRKLVTEWGGEISFESTLRVGTTFRVALPSATPSTTSVVARQHVELDGNSRRVLVVDDNPNVRRTVSVLLEDANFVTLEAGDGLEALGVARDSYDVIVTDLMMPRLTGVELIEKVRASQTNPPPILLISGYADDETRRRVESSGITVLRKPFDRNGLLLGLAKTLNAGCQPDESTPSE